MKTAVVLVTLAAAAAAQQNAVPPHSDEYFSLKDSLTAFEASMTASLAELNASIATLAVSMTTVQHDASVMVGAVTTTVEVKTNQTKSLMAAAMSEARADLSSRVAPLTSTLQALQQSGTSQVTAASSWLGSSSNQFSRTMASQVSTTASSVEAATATFTRSLTQMEAATVAHASTQIRAVVTQASRALAPVAALSAAMATTHYLVPSTPMFRWHMFHVYSNNGVGWFDGNNPRFFGGRHPSQWGDGNTVVWDMHPDWSYMARIFTRRAVGSVAGATVCSETWYLYSSTDTKYCMALFRVRNTQSSTVGWSVNWYGTGWSGWGNYQSTTMNAVDNWSGSCTWWCHRGRTFPLPGNRVSTIIFANGMCHPNHYADNHHIETTFLGFDNLNLPRGLEYVDDLDAVANSGRWR